MLSVILYFQYSKTSLRELENSTAASFVPRWVCTKLENFPRGLGKLISLRFINVTTKQSVLPHDEFVSLIHLQTLIFHYCDNIEFLV